MRQKYLYEGLWERSPTAISGTNRRRHKASQWQCSGLLWGEVDAMVATLYSDNYTVC